MTELYTLSRTYYHATNAKQYDCRPIVANTSYRAELRDWGHWHLTTHIGGYMAQERIARRLRLDAWLVSSTITRGELLTQSDPRPYVELVRGA